MPAMMQALTDVVNHLVLSPRTPRRTKRVRSIALSSIERALRVKRSLEKQRSRHPRKQPSPVRCEISADDHEMACKEAEEFLASCTPKPLTPEQIKYYKSPQGKRDLERRLSVADRVDDDVTHVSSTPVHSGDAGGAVIPETPVSSDNSAFESDAESASAEDDNVEYEVDHMVWARTGRANWEPAQIVKIHRTRDGHRYDVEFWFKKGGNYTCGQRYRSERLRPFNVDTCRDHCFRLSSAPWSKRVDEAVCAYNRATRRRHDRFTIDWATAECVECI
jgi:hypothetical protein